MKRLLRIITRCLALLIVLTTALVLSTASEVGTRAVVNFAVWAGRGNASIDEVSGTLWSKLILHNIKVQQPSFSYQVAEVRLNLDILHWRVGLATIPNIHIEKPNLKLIRRQSDNVTKRVIHTLPFDIHLDSVSLANGELETADGQRFTLTHGALQAALSGTQLNLSKINFVSPKGHLNGQIQLGLQADFPLNLALKWKVLQPDQQWGSGVFNATGRRPHYQWDLLAQAPVVANMTGRMEWLVGQKPTFDTQLSWSDLRWPLWGAPHYQSPRGTAKLRGGLDNYQLDVDADWGEGQALLNMQAAVQGRFDPYQQYSFANTVELNLRKADKWHVALKGHAEGNQSQQRFAISLRDPFWLDLNTTVSHVPSGEPQLEATAEWKNFRLPWHADAVAQLTSDSGRLTAKGTLHNYVVNLIGKLGGAHVPTGDWTAKGEGDLSHVRVTEALGQSLGGVVQATGDLRWANPIGWTVDLVAKELNAGEKWPLLTSTVSFAGHIDGLFMPEEGKPLGTLTVRDLTGTWKGLPLTGHGEVSWFMGGVDLSDVIASLDGFRMQGNGRITQEIDVQVSADKQSLSVLDKSLGGDAALDLRFSGASQLPKIDLKVLLDNVDWGGLGIGSADLAATLSDKQNIDLNGQLSKVKIFQEQFTDAALQVQGSFTQQTISLNMQDSKTHSAKMVVDASVKNGEWQGALRDVAWQHPMFGSWKNTHPSAFHISSRGIDFEQLCLALAQQSSRLCARANGVPARTWKAEVGLTDYLLATTLESKSGRIKVSAPLNANTTLTLSPQAYQLNWQAQVAEGSIQFLDRLTQTFRYHQAAMSGELAPGKFSAQAKTQIGDGGMLSVQSSITGWRDFTTFRDGNLDARLQMSTNQLHWVQLLIPAFEQPVGLLVADMKLSGTPSQPAIQGTATLKDGAVRVPELGIALSNVLLEARANNPKTIDISGKLSSGKGQMALQGQFFLPSDEPWRLNMNVAGKDFEAVDLGDTIANISPDLNFSITPQLIDVDGVLAVPYASVVGQELGADAVRTSPDVIIINEQKADSSSLKAKANGRWPVKARVLFKLSDRVYFSNANLSGRITGEVLAIEELNRNTHADGYLQIVDGKYEAYGQKLDITRGRLQFIGPLDNPGLDVEAVRKIGEVTAGVKVTGTLKSPILKPFSNPPKPDRDIISYILFGRPIKQANSSERNALAEVFVGFGLSQGSPIAKQIAERIGIEGLTVTTETGDTGDSSVVFGGYFSPRLYVSYGVGILGPARGDGNAGNNIGGDGAGSRVNLRYKINEKWSIEAGSGTETGGVDFIYSIER